ncbi:hypothetical protein P692DRAFT_20827571 [Suillus brevipes Sb2]|nr:hypothetical protein P692DRAFT_20827571 [Suillus brevipes Sb2]
MPILHRDSCHPEYHDHMRDTCGLLRKSVLVLAAYCSLLILSTNYDQPNIRCCGRQWSTQRSDIVKHRTQSVLDIERELYGIFNKHPDSRKIQSGELAVPTDAILDVLNAFSDSYNHDGVDLLVLASSPGIEVTPQILLQFVAERTRYSPQDCPNNSPLERM